MPSYRYRPDHHHTDHHRHQHRHRSRSRHSCRWSRTQCPASGMWILRSPASMKPFTSSSRPQTQRPLPTSHTCMHGKCIGRDWRIDAAHISTMGVGRCPRLGVHLFGSCTCIVPWHSPLPSLGLSDDALATPSDPQNTDQTAPASSDGAAYLLPYLCISSESHLARVHLCGAPAALSEVHPFTSA